jgi:hypothetical protein
MIRLKRDAAGNKRIPADSFAAASEKTALATMYPGHISRTKKLPGNVFKRRPKFSSTSRKPMSGGMRASRTANATLFKCLLVNFMRIWSKVSSLRV